MIGCGSFVMAAALIPSGLQPSVPPRVLDMACNASMWMYSIGFVMAFTALFAKSKFVALFSSFCLLTSLAFE